MLKNIFAKMLDVKKHILSLPKFFSIQFAVTGEAIIDIQGESSEVQYNLFDNLTRSRVGFCALGLSVFKLVSRFCAMQNRKLTITVLYNVGRCSFDDKPHFDILTEVIIPKQNKPRADLNALSTGKTQTPRGESMGIHPRNPKKKFFGMPSGEERVSVVKNRACVAYIGRKMESKNGAVFSALRLRKIESELLP